MEIYQCGTKVKALQSNIEGVITGINIRFENIQYELSYWKDGTHNAVWVYEIEITSEKEKQKIGFIK